MREDEEKDIVDNLLREVDKVANHLVGQGQPVQIREVFARMYGHTPGDPAMVVERLIALFVSLEQLNHQTHHGVQDRTVLGNEQLLWGVPNNHNPEKRVAGFARSGCPAVQRQPETPRLKKDDVGAIDFDASLHYEEAFGPEAALLKALTTDARTNAFGESNALKVNHLLIQADARQSLRAVKSRVDHYCEMPGNGAGCAFGFQV